MIPVVLTVGALDPSGADGLAADMRSFAALGVHGAAVAAQLGDPAEPLDPALVAGQIGAALAAAPARAVKTGALGSAEVVRAVAKAIADCDAPLVADASFAQPGDTPDPALVASWAEALLPRADIVVANMAEAALLTGTGRAATLGDMRRQGEALLALGCRQAIVTGGHGASEFSIDVMVMPDQPAFEMRGERLERGGQRGLSATLAAAIAAHLAHRMVPNEAINHAKLFVSTALGAADRLGDAAGPLVANQMYRMWRRQLDARDA